MGERKGTNHYYPPDYDPKKGGLNKFLGTHALRERARKIHLGILIIRFEMPYNIWCEGCNNHIGMGVRYNAEKTKIGMYYTTPVYQFRMKCHLCDNHFEIKTDPGNLDYVIVSGARRQENRWDPTQNEQVVPETKETQKKLFDDPMYKLEHGSDDLLSANEAKPRLAKLYSRNEKSWNDDFAANQLLRKEFRKKRKDIQITAEQDKKLLKKACIDIKLLPETEEDKKLASLLLLNPVSNLVESSMKRIEAVIDEPALKPTSIKCKRKSLIQPLSRKDLGIIPTKKICTTVSNTNVTVSEKIEKFVADNTLRDANVDESEVKSENERNTSNLMGGEINMVSFSEKQSVTIEIDSSNIENSLKYSECMINDVISKSIDLKPVIISSSENLTSNENLTESKCTTLLQNCLVGDYGSTSGSESET